VRIVVIDAAAESDGIAHIAACAVIVGGIDVEIGGTADAVRQIGEYGDRGVSGPVPVPDVIDTDCVQENGTPVVGDGNVVDLVGGISDPMVYP
jgi:hypothetical protein